MRFESRFVLLLATLFLTSARAEEPKIRVGDTFPAFDLPAIDGKGRVDSKSLEGKVAVIDLWASDCPPCREAVPVLDEFTRTFKSKSLVVVGISVDEKPEETKSFLKEFRPSYRNADDGKHQFVPRLGIELMPTTFVVDKKRKVLFINKGFRSGDAGKLKKAISEALAR